jgi:MoaE-MoaD fusion protein
VAIAIAVRARYFARLRELAGVEIEVVHMSGGSTLGDAYRAAREKHPALPEQQGVRGAVNHEFAGWDAKIANGDEVAFIPPVSGGGFPCATR